MEKCSTDMLLLLAALTDKDDKRAYEKAKEIMEASALGPGYYGCLEAFAGLMQDKSSFVRTRGFLLCCSQARWDSEGRLKTVLPLMLSLFHDERPTVVRQALQAVKEVIAYRPELRNAIEKELEKTDVSGYQESVRPLLEKGIAGVREALKTCAAGEDDGR